jgi:hypothetical protein
LDFKPRITSQLKQRMGICLLVFEGVAGSVSVIMKSRQLANVLIKMMGLSICIYGIPTCVSGILFDLLHPGASVAHDSDTIALRIFTSIGAGGIEALLGIIIIAMSRTVAGWMFTAEE